MQNPQTPPSSHNAPRKSGPSIWAIVAGVGLLTCVACGIVGWFGYRTFTMPPQPLPGASEFEIVAGVGTEWPTYLLHGAGVAMDLPGRPVPELEQEWDAFSKALQSGYAAYMAESDVTNVYIYAATYRTGTHRSPEDLIEGEKDDFESDADGGAVSVQSKDLTVDGVPVKRAEFRYKISGREAVSVAIYHERPSLGQYVYFFYWGEDEEFASEEIEHMIGSIKWVPEWPYIG